ncbi:MAG: hypothetical protein ABSC64_18650 [Candidatus Korobacteraceae bacterium]|jgi:hypothetical protein
MADKFSRSVVSHEEGLRTKRVRAYYAKVTPQPVLSARRQFQSTDAAHLLEAIPEGAEFGVDDNDPSGKVLE